MQPAPYTGTLLGESLRTGAMFDGLPLTVTRIFRLAAGDTGAGQPELWTFIEFEVPAAEAQELAQALAQVLDDVGGWYCNFSSPDETFVVFAKRVFRYPSRDPAERQRVEAYARSVGVPEAQIDWPD